MLQLEIQVTIFDFVTTIPRKYMIKKINTQQQDTDNN